MKLFMKAPKVSIIVPVYNSALTIECCIKSIINQNYNNIECILVENGSTDNSEVLCKKYAEKYEFIQTVVCSNKGVSAARNLGLSMATGDIIGFCDADDFMEPNAISAIVYEFTQNNDIVCIIGGFYFGNIMEGRIKKQYRGLKRKRISAEEAKRLIITNNKVMGSVWNKYYRADILHNIWFDTDLSYCEDTHFNIKVMSHVAADSNILVIEQALYCYMNNGSSVTNNLQNSFDEHGNLKYITALKATLNDFCPNGKLALILKRKICEFSVDFAVRDIDEMQRKKLMQELKTNYTFTLRNLTNCSIAARIKRLLKFIILMYYLLRRKK